MAEYAVNVLELEPQPTLVMRGKVAPPGLSSLLGEFLPAIYQQLVARQLRPGGQPFTRYLDMKDGQFHVEAGIPLVEPADGEGEIEAATLPGGDVASTVHTGPYSALGQAHEAVRSWAAENGREPVGGSWEVYLTDPGEEPDENNWKTAVFLALKS